MARWLGNLEKKLEQYSSESHPKYRVFISAEPAPTPDTHIIPQGILEAAIKITNEAPTGMFANLHKALDNFSQVRFRGVQYVHHCVMHKCIMVKVGGNKKHIKFVINT